METNRQFAVPLSRKHHLFIIALGLLLVLFIAIAFASVPLTNIFIHFSLPLKQQGLSFTVSNWLTIPFPILTSFYLFNVTNAEDVVRHSAKPILQEIGPFVYEERRAKNNVAWSDDGSTVSYNQTRTFHYREDLSTHNFSLNQSIYHLNVPLASAIEYARRAQDDYYFWAIASLINETNSQVFEKHTISQLLFEGYDDPLINETTWLGKFPYDKFGWMYMRNGSSTDGRYTINTGYETLSNIGQVVSWNNKRSIEGYDNECAQFGSASAGDLFPPDNSVDAIELFVGDTCRPISLNFSPEKSSDPYMTFVGDASTYATKGTCYCTENPCPPNGIANISSCVAGSPVYISFPHFLHGDESLVHQFEGLQPNHSRHAFSFQVDQRLGVPTQVNVAMQLNIALIVSDRFNFTLFQKEPIVYYPSIYFTSTAGVPDSMKKSLNFLHFTLPVIVIAIPAILALFCLMSIALVVRKVYKQHQSQDDMNDRLISRSNDDI